MIFVDNIKISFGEKVVFNNFKISFEENKIHVIVGKSGCGKTTLLRAIAGLIKTEQGKVVYNGNEIKKPNKDIFMMHQGYTNFLWKTCRDNVLFPIKLQKKLTKEHEKEAVEMLKTVGLEEYADKYPYELSGGMKQRLALARTLMSKPPVILMDEPLSALDPKTRNEMQNLLLDLHAKTKNTIIMITHDMEEANKMKDEIIKL